MIAAAILLVSFTQKGQAQVNLAPLVTSISASNVSTGVISDFNDLDYGNCGTQDVWISTSNPPSSNPGDNWIEWEWATARTFDKIDIHNGYTDRRYLTGGLIQVYDFSTSSWVNAAQISGGAGVCVQSYSFSPVTAKRMRLTSFQMTGAGQTSNPSFREIVIWEANLSNDNAGVVSLDEPYAFCAGTYPVKVTIKNFGLNQIDSVKVNWSINDTLQSLIHYKNMLDTNNGAGPSEAQITLGTLSFPDGVTKWIKVWTSEPNGVNDTINENDTLLIGLKPGLHGTYTIGGTGADYPDFSSAVADLNAAGVCQAVEFMVAAGTYNERIQINRIVGSSSINTVRFVGAGKGSTILSNAGTSTADFVTVMLDGADFVEFRDMTIRGTGTTNGIGVMFTNQADSNAFRNVNVEVNTTATGTAVTGIAFSSSKTSATGYGNNGNYNHIDSVNVTGGYYGIRLNGASTSLAVLENKITNTRVEAFYYYGIYAYYNSRLTIDNCYIENTRNQTNADGLYTVYMANVRFTNNTIISGDYALYMSSLNSASYYDPNLPTEIHNNMISSTADYGVYASGAGKFNFINNSVNTSSNYTLYFTGGSDVVMYNNQIRNYRTSASSYSMYATCGFDSMDYNNYQSLGTGTMINMGGTLYNDFASYQADQVLFGFEEHSASQDPNFTSNTDLHIDQSIPALRGANMGIVYDIDGDLRCEIAPTLGADESEYVNPSPTAGIAGADTIYINSPTTFFSTYQPVAGVLWDYTWYVDDILQSNTLDFVKTFSATGTYEVKLRARSCSGSDRDSIMVDVVNPTSTPVTDFTASKLVVDVLEGSVLSDLSDFGPTQWEWTASPASDAVFSDAYASNPTVFFLNPGVYEICLQTWNGLGQGSTLCKTAYISVNEDAQMCYNTESTMAAGRITDDGGAGSNYSANSNCSFLIHPCASEVTLRFTQWNLSDADDELKVYDGSDNTGTLLGTFNSNSNIPGGAGGLVASSGKMYLEWRTSPAGQTAGFTGYWTSTPAQNVPVPTADFTTQDTVFIDQVVTFSSSSTGAALNYAWDFDPPFQQAGLDGGNDETDRYSWSTAGTYPVQLTVNNCGGTDDIIKNIQVIAPTSAPVVGFYADRTKVPVLSTVTLKDSSFQGGTSWKWTITPAATTNMLSPDNGQELKVAFIKSGKYTVKLKVTNSVGSDSLTRVDYIEVFDYCAPVVGNISTDVAISRVKFGGIDNYSATGAAKYTSYLNDFTPEVVALRDSITIRIERQSTTDPLNRKVWIDWNNDGDFDDTGEEVATESSSQSQSYTSTFVVPNTATIGFTTLRVGVSYDQDANKPCGINPTGEFEDYPIQVIIDKQAPVITKKGQDTVWVEKGYQYLDAGATAMDNVDGDLTGIMITSNPVDSTVVGTYVVRYNVSDMDGNAATEVTRIVIVTPDVTAPVITLNGPASVNVTVGTSYTDDGATAEDYYLQDLTGQMMFGDNIDLNVLGTYSYWYTVEDASGNKDSVAREVNVVDDIAPVLILLGDNPLVVEVKTNINEPGSAVTDNYDQNVQVTVDS
ncbi:MAG TPA: hypothetical protein DIW47_03845, partial [Bacteroidetes bacterium]|nr:hypothetical protein [Bacteroidota bacterium]